MIYSHGYFCFLLFEVWGILALGSLEAPAVEKQMLTSQTAVLYPGGPRSLNQGPAREISGTVAELACPWGQREFHLSAFSKTMEGLSFPFLLFPLSFFFFFLTK
jgi:hypothetical protein